MTVLHTGQLGGLVLCSNVLIFEVDISRDRENLRLIVRDIKDLERTYLNQKMKFNIYLSKYSLDLIDELLTKKINENNDLFVYFHKNDKLVSLDFSKNYQIKNFAFLDKLNEARKVNYSVELM